MVKKAGGDYVVPMALNLPGEKVRQKMEEAFSRLYPNSKLGFSQFIREGYRTTFYSSWINQFVRILSKKYGVRPIYRIIRTVPRK